ncbi:MAG: hypothetical protein HUK21_01580 [Fibrobacteraceae bacterium]|nr:hypothetical protein [Fibrobacteraceae bacterium]
MKNIVLMILLLALAAFGNCRISNIQWSGSREKEDEAFLAHLVGEPCGSAEAVESIGSAVMLLQEHYENKGFVGAQVFYSIEGTTLYVELKKGLGYVWAASENLDSGKTRPAVFQRLSGLTVGAPVSLFDLRRSDRKLSRLGYYEKTAEPRMFRDPVRNRIVPAFSLKKANVSEAEGFLTYSSESNVWEGKIDVSLYNILGTARDLVLEGYSLENSRSMYGFYKEPWVLGTFWSVLFRGSFEEEVLETREKNAYGEVGVSRDIGFDFNISIFLGIGSNDKRTSMEVEYVSLDRFSLPRRGTHVKMVAAYRMNRPDSLENLLYSELAVAHYIPIYGNFISRFCGKAGGVFPTDGEYLRSDLFALGGLESFKGMQYRETYSRSYGFSELALLWQDGYDLSLEIFYQPGLYRRMWPGHGWALQQSYGLGFTQYRENWSISIYYAMTNGKNYLDGILGFGVKTLF